MTQAHQRTVDTYNRAAEFLIEHYETFGNRAGDVHLGFALAGNPQNAHVLEIGCGYGRDAREILAKTPFYTGLDASSTLLDTARKRVPKAEFVEADAEEYDYPANEYDIVFSFAALRHLDQSGVQTVLQKVYNSLRPGGLFYISLNFGDRYSHTERKDRFGHRDVYLYNPRFIQKLAGPGFKITHEHYEEFDGTPWFEIALQKSSA